MTLQISSEDYHIIVMTRDTIHAVTQSIISIVVVLGGGITMFLRPDIDNTPIITLMGVVLTFYFSQSSATRAAVTAGNQVAQAYQNPQSRPTP